MSTDRMIKLISSDKEEFVVDLSIMQDSRFVMNNVEDTGMENPVILHNVSSNLLTKVIEYCTYHVRCKESTDEKPAATEEEIKHWDAQFVQVEHATLVGLINAANYLDMKNLLDVMCQRVADLIMGKTPEEIRTTFGIVNDFTPEEEETIRQENEWVFR